MSRTVKRTIAVLALILACGFASQTAHAGNYFNVQYGYGGGGYGGGGYGRHHHHCPPPPCAPPVCGPRYYRGGYYAPPLVVVPRPVYAAPAYGPAYQANIYSNGPRYGFNFGYQSGYGW